MRTLFIILLLIIPFQVQGSNITSRELTNACLNSSSASQNFCYGFIIATANAALFYRNLVDVDNEYIDICFPDNISNEQIVDLFLAWSRSHPELEEVPAFIGVSTSFSTKYSCPSSSEN